MIIMKHGMKDKDLMELTNKANKNWWWQAQASGFADGI